MIKDFMTVSILKLSIFGFTHVKDVCILTELKNCLRDAKDSSQPQFADFKKSHIWLFGRDFEEFVQTVQL